MALFLAMHTYIEQDTGIFLVTNLLTMVAAIHVVAIGLLMSYAVTESARETRSTIGSAFAGAITELTLDRHIKTNSVGM